MSKAPSSRMASVAPWMLGLAIILPHAVVLSQTQQPASAAAVEKTALKNARGQVSELLDLDARIAADKLRREAGKPTAAEQQRQVEAAKERVQAAQVQANTPPPAPPAPEVEAIYGVGSQLTAVVAYNGQQYEFRAGNQYALGHSRGPKLKSINGRCVSLALPDGAKTACYRQDRNLGPGAEPAAYNRSGGVAGRQDSTTALPGQYGVVPPPPPFLSK